MNNTNQNKKEFKPIKPNINKNCNASTNVGALHFNEDNTEKLLEYKKENNKSRVIPKRVLLVDDEISESNIPQQKQLIQLSDYVLDNSNEEAFKVVKTRKQIPWYIIVPAIAFLMLLAVGAWVLGMVTTVPKPAFTLVHTTPVDSEAFKNKSTEQGLEIDERDLGSNISSICAHTDDFSYEIQFIKFEEQKQALAYYNYIIESAAEVQSSYSKSIRAASSAERTLVSKTYNALVDISYINNTIVIGLAYNTNEYDTMISYINSIGY